MQRTARVFANNRCQAVRLPKEFRFAGKQVFIRKERNAVILSEWPADWSELLSSDAMASERFMRGVVDPAPEAAL